MARVLGLRRIGRQAAGGAILGDCRSTEDFRQRAVPDPPLEFHLPQPILRVREAQAEERIALRRCEDVRDGIGVAHDLDRPRQAFDANRAACLRQRSAQVRIRAGADRC